MERHELIEYIYLQQQSNSWLVSRIDMCSSVVNTSGSWKRSSDVVMQNNMFEGITKDYESGNQS
jgi:hypothetical protein